MRNPHNNPNRASGTSGESLTTNLASRGATNYAVTDEFEAAVVVDVIMDETHP
jgi:hypothetical protein